MNLPVSYSSLTSIEKRNVRLQYIKEQNNLCLYCLSSLTENPPKIKTDLKITLSLFPKGFLDHPVHLHHNHKTDLTIGAVHSYCNAILWEYHNE